MGLGTSGFVRNSMEHAMYRNRFHHAMGGNSLSLMPFFQTYLVEIVGYCYIYVIIQTVKLLRNQLVRATAALGPCLVP